MVELLTDYYLFSLFVRSHGADILPTLAIEWLLATIYEDGLEAENSFKKEDEEKSTNVCRY